MEEKSVLLSLPANYALGMKQQPKYKWWKPIVAGLLAFLFTMVFMVAFTMVIGVVAAVFGGADGYNSLAAMFASDSDNYLGADGDNVFAMAFSLGSVAIFLPAVGLANKIMGLGGFGRLSSVEGKLRWKRVWALFPWALLVAVVVMVLEIGLSVLAGEPLGEVRFPVATIIVILILCPLQCAAEEYLCRGFLMQTFGSWIPIVVIPLILQAIIFTILHGYNIVGLIGVLIMGLMVGYFTLKTGGLEAGICIHTANNLPSFLLSAIFASAQTQTNVEWISLVPDLALQVLFFVVIYQICKRKGYWLR